METRAELNAVLTGLRLLQEELSRGRPLRDDLADIFLDGLTRGEELTGQDIDELCERLNGL